MHFPGTPVWTIINGQNGTFLVQGINGLVVVRSTIAQNDTCETQYLCLDSKITKVKNSVGAFKVGDEAKIKIDLNNKQETVSFLSGFFEGVEIPIIFSNMWMAQNTGANSTIANPASTYCINHGGTLQIKTYNAGQHGVCVFPNGSECEEWQYYRGECNPAQTSNSTNSTSH